MFKALTVQNFLKGGTTVVFETFISVPSYPVIDIPIIGIVQLHSSLWLELDVVACSKTEMYSQLNGQNFFNVQMIWARSL